MNAPDPEKKDVKVSVCMVTYNHEAFVAQAIDSVLMQEADFDYELVIGEDCSTDGTRKICIEYAMRYPDRIRLLLPEQNQGMIPNFLATLAACHGQYIALCDGDDYWTDAHKLQKQVLFLELHPGHSACFHPIHKLVQATGEMDVWRFRHQPTRSSYTLEDVLRGSEYVRTGSVMFRRASLPELPAWFHEAPVGDWPLLVLLAQQGKLGFIDQAMSAYRVHDGGMSSAAAPQVRYLRVTSMLETVREHLGPEHQKLIAWHLSTKLGGLAAMSADRGDLVNGRAYFWRSVAEYPMMLHMRILDRLVLLVRLYAPPVYRAAKYVQTGLGRTGKSHRGKAG